MIHSIAGGLKVRKAGCVAVSSNLRERGCCRARTSTDYAVCRYAQPMNLDCQMLLVIQLQYGETLLKQESGEPQFLQ